MGVMEAGDGGWEWGRGHSGTLMGGKAWLEHSTRPWEMRMRELEASGGGVGDVG